MGRPNPVPETVSPGWAPLHPPELASSPSGHLPVFGDADLLGEAEPLQVTGAEPNPLSRASGRSPLPEADATAPIAVPETVVSFNAIEEELGDTKADVPLVEAGHPVGLVADDSNPPGGVRHRPEGRWLPGQDLLVRRAATGAAAAMALAALAVGGWQLARGHSPPSPQSVSSPKNSGGSTTPPRVQQTPTSLQPTSVTASLVTYSAPTQSFTVTFTAQTPCWVGAQKTQNPSGPWNWMAEPGMSNGPPTATYRASGPVVIRLGAPKAVQITVNGLPLVLPAGKVQPYDIAFVLDGSISA